MICTYEEDTSYKAFPTPWFDETPRRPSWGGRRGDGSWCSTASEAPVPSYRSQQPSGRPDAVPRGVFSSFPPSAERGRLRRSAHEPLLAGWLWGWKGPGDRDARPRTWVDGRPGGARMGTTCVIDLTGAGAALAHYGPMEAPRQGYVEITWDQAQGWCICWLPPHGSKTGTNPPPQAIASRARDKLARDTIGVLPPRGGSLFSSAVCARRTVGLLWA